uniref:Uncharacterized protein n=1 Tax=Varanus komodoensis TaxID=61221 RepID=A0A8D2J3A2_VARKO
MSQLGARLEEKRRAIEAQKKRIEAIFTRHRQRLGKSAFLQLQKCGSSPCRLLLGRPGAGICSGASCAFCLSDPVSRLDSTMTLAAAFHWDPGPHYGCCEPHFL